MASGQAFTQSDVDAGAKAVILGQTVVERLFGRSANPVGQTVRIGKSPFSVVGVLERFEVWSPDAWASFLRESEHLLDDVTGLPSTSKV